MRIACIHLPQLSLQCVTRVEPSLRTGALVVVGHSAGEGRSVLSAPIVVASSRAAWALGVRLGMTATTARSVSPEVRVVHGDPAVERETIRAIADTLLAATAVVDVGGRIGAGGAHLAMYAEVPAKMRGTAFGEHVHELVEQLGLTARVGIADDRFTAWVAASSGDDRHVVVSVPRGGSAAFLAPRPLSLLAIAPEVQHVLEALGVSTLGEFAALPAPSVARPIERDYQALARGESGTTLRPYAPDAAIREEVAIGAGGGGLGTLGAIDQLAQRLALRLAGRGRFATKLEVVEIGATGDRTWPIEPPRPIAGEGELAQALAPAAAATSWRLRVVVAGEGLAAPAGETGDAVPVPVVDVITAPIDPIAVVLASPGTGDLFGDLPATPRRDLHRRMRRGKQRRRLDTPAQPRLFER